MAISYIGAASAEATTLTMPTHQAGDLLLMFALSLSGSVPVLPSGWLSLFGSGGTNTTRHAYKIATSSSELSGTWTNAAGLICCVYRPASGSIALPKLEGTGSTGGNGTTITGNVSSANGWAGSGAWSFFCASMNTTANDLSVVGTGMTLRSHLVGSTFEIAVSDSNGVMENYTGGGLAVGATSAYWRGCCGQIAEITPGASSGGIAPPLVNSQALVRGFVLA